MALVALSLAATEEVLAGYGERLSVAVNSSPASTVVSGDPEAIEELVAELGSRDVFCRQVKVDYASHSRHMDPLRDALLDELDGLAPRPGEVLFVSTVSGGPVEGERLGSEYWWSNIRQPVLFAKAIENLANEGRWLFLEVSAHPLLTAPVAQTLAGAAWSDCEIFGSLRKEEAERWTLLATLGALHTRGCSVDWSALYPRGRSVALPPYPWQRQSFWLEEPPEDRRRTATGPRRSGSAEGHPIVVHHLPSPVDAATHFFELESGLDRLPYLTGHRVQGAVVLPAAAYVESVLAAAARIGHEGGGRIALRKIRFERPLFLEPGDEARILLAITPEVSGGSRFEFVRRDGKGWETLARGLLAADGPDEPAVSETLRDGGWNRLAEEVDADSHFRAMERRGIENSGLFRAVQRAWRSPGEAVARVGGPAEAAAGYRFHPALLDGCFQALVQAVPETGAGIDAADTYLPVAIDELRLFASPRPGADLLSHAVIAGSPDGSGSVVEGRLTVVEEEGRSILEIDGFRFQRLGESPANGTRLDQDCFFGTFWHEAPPLPDVPAPNGAPPRGPWLLFGDRELGPALGEALEQRGEQVLHVDTGVGFEARSDRRFAVDPTAPGDFVRLLEAAADGEGPRQILFLWALDAPPVDRLDHGDLAAAQDRLCGGLLHLIQALRSVGPDRPPRLWIVTRAAQGAVAGEPVEIAQAPLWGLARVLGSEQPDLVSVRVDLGRDGSPEDGRQALLRELLASDRQEERQEEVALRGGRRLVHRVARRGPNADAKAGTERRRPLEEGEAYRLVTIGPGILDNLVPRVLGRREPAAGCVEIEVRATGVNFMNVLSAMGMYPGYPDGVGTLGTECAGVVTACGEGVGGVRPGDRVMAIAPDSMGSHVEVNAHLAVPMPRGLSFAQAATLPVAFATSYHALVHLGRIEAGERVLIHSATGGVGRAALQIAFRAGAEVFATAGTEQKRELLRSLGVRAALESRSLEFVDRVRELTGGDGVDLVLNSLAGEALEASFSLLGPYGRFLELGKRDIHADRPLGLRPFQRNLSFFAIDLFGMILERPALLGAHLQAVARAVERGDLQVLPFEASPVASVVETFRTMAQAEHVGKLVVTQERDGLTVLDDARPGPAVDDGGTYLITGGLGALGLAVARRLVDRGATRLALLGRSEPSPSAREVIAELEAAGATVLPVRADVADRAGLASALDEIRSASSPLRGVVHAAGLLEDRLLVNTELESFRRVTAPKIGGAWNLHELTAGDPLDWFILFSSGAVLVGSPGQGSYVAGNEFMDALVLHRRALGLPGLSIAWGPWSEIGLAAGAGRADRLSERGLASITPDEGLDAFERLLDGGAGRVAVMRFDLERWSSFYPAARELALYAGLRREAASDRTGEDDGLLRRGRLLTMEPADRPGALSSHLADQISSILRLPAAKIDPKQPIRRFGLDSLMAVELKNRIEADFGVSIPIVRLLQGVTITDLSDEVMAAVVPDGEEGAHSDASAEELLARVDELSDDEVDALLENLSADGGGLS